VAALALVVAVQDRRRGAWLVFVVASALASYMLLLAAIVVVAQLVSLSLLGRGRPPARAIAIVSVAIALLWSPLLLVAVRQGRGQLAWIAPPTLRNSLSTVPFLLSASGAAAVTVVG